MRTGSIPVARQIAQDRVWESMKFRISGEVCVAYVRYVEDRFRVVGVASVKRKMGRSARCSAKGGRGFHILVQSRMKHIKKPQLGDYSDEKRLKEGGCHQKRRVPKGAKVNVCARYMIR